MISSLSRYHFIFLQLSREWLRVGISAGISVGLSVGISVGLGVEISVGLSVGHFQRCLPFFLFLSVSKPLSGCRLVVLTSDLYQKLILLSAV